MNAKESAVVEHFLEDRIEQINARIANLDVQQADLTQQIFEARTLLDACECYLQSVKQNKPTQ